MIEIIQNKPNTENKQTCELKYCNDSKWLHPVSDLARSKRIDLF